MKLILIFLITFIAGECSAWDSEQLEVFDAIEEVKENFYELLNISQNATDREIKTAFRSLSLKLHPDKNLDTDTSVQFRNLVSVYEVLRSKTKRNYYDEYLVNGLPNWRSAVYYYRYYRKLGLAETCIILFLILTICQYLINWAAYYEKKYNLEKMKKSKKRKEIIIPPSIYDTLPIQIPKFIWFIITEVIPYLFETIKSYREAQTVEESEEEEPAPKEKTVRKKHKGFTIPEGPNFETTSTTNLPLDENSVPVKSGGLWTDDDFIELTRLMKKYPSGTLDRWSLIADVMGRSPQEVAYMANKIKQNAFKVELEGEEEERPVEIKVKPKTRKNAEITTDNVKKWSQQQQKALEEALAKYPKGCTDRWDRIAEHIPEKTKEECMLRYRYLAENLKKQRNPDNSNN